MRPFASIYIDYTRDGYHIALAVLESPSSGGWFCEIKSDQNHPYSAIDKLLHLIFVADIDKIIIGYSSAKYYEDILENFSLFEIIVDTDSIDEIEQNRLFRDFFHINSLLKPIEHLDLDSRALASIALAMAVKNIKYRYDNFWLPRFLNIDNFIVLANNPLEQIDYISYKELSINKILTKPATAIAKRIFRYRLLLPIDNTKELNRRLDLVEAVATQNSSFRRLLESISDIEELYFNIYCRDFSKVEIFLKRLESIKEIQELIGRYKISIDFSDIVVDDDFLVWIKNAIYLKEHKESIDAQMRMLLDFVVDVDIAVASAVDLRKYNLTRPTFIDSDSNFLQINGIRNLLIESVVGSYVTNDIILGDRGLIDFPYPNSVLNDLLVHDGNKIDGVLLYGINASGKSSLMKSVAIAVLMAQSGFFVPAKAMRFRVFDGVFTRISSKDKISSSLSTFGVEMLELNNIFKNATAKSLVIADEISHGTETLSAVAIVASAILELSTKGSLFFMTTHLHQLSQVKELQKVKNVASLHLALDSSAKETQFDRVLRAGRGESIYGLEFASSMNMGSEFLKNAYHIRDYLSKESAVLELHNKKEFTRRFRDLYVCECAICGEFVESMPTNNKMPYRKITLCAKDKEAIIGGKIKIDRFFHKDGEIYLGYEKVL